MFAFVFLSCLTASFLLRFYLSMRQMRHVKAHQSEVPQAFSEKVSLSSHQRAANYTVDKIKLGLIILFIETTFLLCLTFGGLLQTLHDFWNFALEGSRIIEGVLLVGSVTIISGLIDLPASLYAQFSIEQKYGFNRMTFALFLSDLVKQLLLSAAIGIPLLAAIFWLMDSMGNFWWLYVWAFLCAFMLLAQWIAPTFIAPLFNKFTPLEEGELKTRIEALLNRCGFTSSGLFVMDGSKRSGHGNAYFSGFGKTKRIVFFDTLINRLSADEIEAVLAHELGHFKKKHIIKRIVMMFLMSLFFLFLLATLKEAPWFYQGLGVTINENAQTTPIAFLLFFSIVPIFTFPLTPVFSAMSRKHEFEADQYAAEQSNKAYLISALVRLYEDNAATLTPDPLHSLFYDSHPSALIRINHLERLS